MKELRDHRRTAPRRQMEQLPLLERALDGEELFRVTWLAPNRLAYPQLFERPLANVALASIFVGSSSLFSGCFGFLISAWPPAFWLWEIAGRGPAADQRRAFLRALVLGLFFFLAHLVWLPAALGLFALAVALPIARARDRHR